MGKSDILGKAPQADSAAMRAAKRAAKQIRGHQWTSNVTADEAMIAAIITEELEKQ